MPRKRKLSNEEVEDESEEVENGVRTKRRAAVEARDRVVAREGASDDDDEEEDDEDDEDYECGDDAKDEDFDGKGAGDEEGDEEAEDDEEGDEENDEADVEGEDDDEEEADEEELESEPIDCILAELEEPTADAPGYVLKKKDSPKKLEMCFMGEMRETLADISEAFTTHFEEKKLPVLHITKYDTIGDVKDTIQIDVLAFKYDKAYDIREMEEESDDILSQNFYSMVKVDGIDGIWATQYFLQED